MSEFDYLATGTAEDSQEYHDTMSLISNGYSNLIENGTHPSDARGVLPTNITTNILCKCNLRSLSQLLNIRLCVKAQGEFQDVAREMREKVLEVHPWTDPVLQVHCVQHGSCAFPTYQDCPVKEAGFCRRDPEEQYKIQRIWEDNRTEAKPKGG